MAELKRSTNLLVARREIGDARGGRKRTSDPATMIGCSRQAVDNTVSNRTLELQKGLSVAYSYRRASTGSMRAAFNAGHIPAVTPTKARITKAVNITLLEVLRMMSPS